MKRALYTVGPNGPLFTGISANGIKDGVHTFEVEGDQQETMGERIVYASTLNIVPSAPIPVPPLSTVSGPAKIKQPDKTQTVDISREPIALKRLKGPSYLDYGQFSSFAPERDEGGTMLGEDVRVVLSQLRDACEGQEEEDTLDDEDKVMDTIDPGIETIETKEPLIITRGTIEKKQAADAEHILKERTEVIDSPLDKIARDLVLLQDLQVYRLENGTNANTAVGDYEKELAESIRKQIATLVNEKGITPDALLPASPLDPSRILHALNPSFKGSLQPISESQQPRLSSQQTIAPGFTKYRGVGRPRLQDVRPLPGMRSASPSTGYRETRKYTKRKRD